ncbi:MAG TPA: amino acid permease [Terriglobales bacterium]|nr:amino acid permease [Terriglobales bacterium]
MSERPELARDLNVYHSGAIVVGVIIGSGIFLVPKRMMEAAGSVELVFAAWIVGGLLSWFGALTYAELGAMKPGAGGEYVYVRDAYGPMMGFLYAWTWFTIGKPASIATVAVAVVRILGEFRAFDFLQVALITSPLLINYGHLLAISLVVVLTYLNYLGVKKAGNFQLFFTLLKVAMILGIIAVGFSYANGGTANFKTEYLPAVGGFSGFMAALIAALWAYDGWNNLNMVAGEIKDPERSIPKALIIGITIVAVLYMLTNAAVQWVLPAETIATSLRPASAAIQAVLGPVGGMVISAGIAFSMFVSINGQILTGARIPFAAARDGYFFKSVAEINPKYHTPSVSLLFQAVLTIILIVVGGAFEDLFNLAIFSAWLFYMIAASSVFVFRMKEPNLPRPYKTWGYPIVPVLFIMASAVLLYYSFIGNVKNSIIGSLVILAGIPIFLYFKAKRVAV